MKHPDQLIRVVTYNIHKGVQGIGPTRRLEIHNLAQAVEGLDADVVCLQEVRQLNRREEKRFKHWPQVGQADFLAPLGYGSVYRTNAVTRHGEHGNALLSRWPVLSHQHEDMSDHRFEQRGLLHVALSAFGRELHVVVVHLGLVRASRVRQVEQLKRFIEREVPPGAPLLLAGDFNEVGSRLRQALEAMDLRAWSGMPQPTFPARLPLAQLDHVFARGLQPVSLSAPQGRPWWRMSDHLPLIAEFVML
ncbi:endonuclease/exonuclease/phosphatase family protein [Rhodoferax sp. U2-2l]|uniref:endonuclease/exonuclease/phosphatase family protein n=1 Tax=Rhodoferax sp. U2-2l TaxID=2884000 RepID=UPI001D0B6D71|nr:endonuclease/exonuclease/phosphatase family protein [Rhodoferax sp. U2-2l]MCB8748285.1 endonuclease/exonuclease/phosphatase family protein [Rhodoferax sp. U2-2l]